MKELTHILDVGVEKPSSENSIVLSDGRENEIMSVELTGLHSDAMLFDFTKHEPHSKARLNEWVIDNNMKIPLRKFCDYLAISPIGDQLLPVFFELTSTDDVGKEPDKLEQLYRSTPLLAYIESLSRRTFGGEREFCPPMYVLVKKMNEFLRSEKAPHLRWVSSDCRIKKVKYNSHSKPIKAIIVEIVPNAKIGIDVIMAAFRDPSLLELNLAPNYELLEE